MKTTLIFLALTTSLAFAQGPLAPPGAPAPTMKTLDQVEARTPISSLPFTINTPGSYYLTGNLQFTATSGHAINILVSNVTLDLNGFTLSSVPAVTGNAINVTDNLGNIEIKNGSIAGNSTVTISGTAPNQTWVTSKAGFSSGLFAGGTEDRTFSVNRLQVTGCRHTGIFCSSGRVSNSVSKSNGSNGIFVDNSSVIDSTANSNFSFGIAAAAGTVINSVANLNGSSGIFSSSGITVNSIASSNGTNGITSIGGNIVNSTTRLNGNIGISAGAGIVTNSLSSFNGSTGISADFGSVTGSRSSNNEGIGISVSSGTVTASMVNSNTGTGVFASNGSVTNCTIRFNASGGNGAVDLDAPNAVVAFTRYGTGIVTGSTETGIR